MHVSILHLYELCNERIDSANKNCIASHHVNVKI